MAHVQVMLAERQRSMREAEEKGKRQEEERRRAKQDEMYRQIMQVQKIYQNFHVLLCEMQEEVYTPC
jgi:hypothetical protein